MTDQDDTTRVDEVNGPRRSMRIKEILKTPVYHQDDNYEDNIAVLSTSTTSRRKTVTTSTSNVSLTSSGKRGPVKFLPSATNRVLALANFMEVDDLSSNSVGRCNGAGCGCSEKRT